MPTFDLQRVRAPLSLHVNPLLTPFKFRLERWCVYTPLLSWWTHCLLYLDYTMGAYIPFFSRTLIYCLLCFLVGCACIPFLTFKSTAYSIFACQPVRPSLQIHCPLQFRFVSETVRPSIFLKCNKLTAYSTFVSKVGPSALWHLNTPLTPFSSLRLCVQALSLHSNPLLTLSLPIFDCQWVGLLFSWN